ncbi:hypothetical protein ACM0JF_01795 [Mycoplasma sp. 654]
MIDGMWKDWKIKSFNEFYDNRKLNIMNELKERFSFENSNWTNAKNKGE